MAISVRKFQRRGSNMLDHTFETNDIQGPSLIKREHHPWIQTAGAMAIIWGKLSVSSVAILIFVAAPDKRLFPRGVEAWHVIRFLWMAGSKLSICSASFR